MQRMAPPQVVMDAVSLLAAYGEKCAENGALKQELQAVKHANLERKTGGAATTRKAATEAPTAPAGRGKSRKAAGNTATTGPDEVRVARV
jgi:hypothetical protein